MNTNDNITDKNTKLPAFELVANRDGWKEVEVNGKSVEIPTNWAYSCIGDLASFLKGKGLSKKDLNTDGLNECIHYGELFTKYDAAATKIISRTNQAKEGMVTSQSGDVLMPTSDVTPNGLATATSVEKDGVILGGDILVIRPNSNKLFSSFLSRVIRKDKDQIMELVSGSTVYHIYAKSMAGFLAKIPPLPEQTRIATVLSAQESHIQDLRSLATVERNRLTWLSDELLSGRIRVVEKVGGQSSVVTKADGEGAETLNAFELVANQDGWKEVELNEQQSRIPQDWKIIAIGQAFDVVGGGTPSTENPSFWGGHIVWTGPKYMGNDQRYVDVDHPDNRKLTVEGAKKVSDRMTPAGSLIVSSRAPVGYANIAPCDLYTNQGCYSLIDNGTAVTDFAYFWVRKNKNILEANASGTTFMEISRKKLSMIDIPLPPLPEQTRIAAVLSAQEQQIADIDALIDVEQKRLQWLTEELLSGRIRVIEKNNI